MIDPFSIYMPIIFYSLTFVFVYFIERKTKSTRMNRKSYAIRKISISILITPVIINSALAKPMSEFEVAFSLIALILTYTYFLYLFTCRFHDFNRSGYWSLIYLFFVPLLTLASYFNIMFLGIVLFVFAQAFILYPYFKKGSESTNRYGEPKVLVVAIESTDA